MSVSCSAARPAASIKTDAATAQASDALLDDILGDLTPGAQPRCAPHLLLAAHFREQHRLPSLDSSLQTVARARIEDAADDAVFLQCQFVYVLRLLPETKFTTLTLNDRAPHGGKPAVAGGRAPGRTGGGNPFARAGARQPGALRRPHRLSMADLDAAGRADAAPGAQAALTSGMHAVGRQIR